MATPGYEPYRVLYHFFHQTGHFKACVGGVSGCRHPLTPEELKDIKGVVDHVTDPHIHPEDSSFVARFAKAMAEDKRHELWEPGSGSPNLYIDEAGLAEGLLECLNPYQAYSPYTMADAIQFAPGAIFDHFKGGVYLVTGFSLWASGDNEQVVEYLSMIYGTKHTRLAEQWCEVAKWPDGKYRSRFVYRGTNLKTPAPEFKVPSPS